MKDRHPKIMRCLSLARGFTLIEILVVLGIIVVLAAVAGPAVNSALVSAKSAESVSHLKQTAALVSNYAAENNNRLPVSINWARFSQGGGMWFQNLIAAQSKELQAAPYSATLRLPKMFYDPVLRGKNEHPWGSFGVNVAVVLNDTDYRARFGNGGGTERGLGISLAALTNPSWKVICCSAVEPGWASSWGFDGAVFAQKGFDPKAGPDPRNSGGAAALFADGHVEKLDVENMDQATRRRLFTLEPAR